MAKVLKGYKVDPATADRERALLVEALLDLADAVPSIEAKHGADDPLAQEGKAIVRCYARLVPAARRTGAMTAIIRGRGDGASALAGEGAGHGRIMRCIEIITSAAERGR